MHLYNIIFARIFRVCMAYSNSLLLEFMHYHLLLILFSFFSFLFSSFSLVCVCVRACVRACFFFGGGLFVTFALEYTLLHIVCKAHRACGR